MNSLCVTITRALTLSMGDRNLRSFIDSGYNNITVNPCYEAMRILNIVGFVEMGFPYYGLLISINTAPLKVTLAHRINLIFYEEGGEVEYGRSTETSKNLFHDINYQKKVYLEGGYEIILSASGLNPNQLNFFSFPSDLEINKHHLQLTHWSYFESWDLYRNYLIAKEYSGPREAEDSIAGTFTSLSQNDQAFFALITYLTYLKSGFGRANQDACIEVRYGEMDREQAVNLVRLYDGHYPEEFVQLYLDYYQIIQAEFDEVIDRYTNQDLFKKIDGRWKPRFLVK